MRGASTPYPEPFLRSDRQKIYYFTYTDHRTGRRLQKSTKCTRKTDAISEIKKFIDSLDDDNNPEANRSFGEYAANFFIDGKCPRQSRLMGDGKTFGAKHMYDSRSSLERVIGREGSDRKKPYAPKPFARIMMKKITRQEVHKLRKQLSEEPGERQGQQVFKAVTAVFAEAVERGHLDRSPAEGIAPYKLTEEQSNPREAFTLPEFQSLWKHRFFLTLSSHASLRIGPKKSDPRAPVVIAMLIGLGLRTGELRSIRWKHIDLKEKQFSILEAMKGTNATSPIGPPKWNKTRTRLRLPQCITDVLVEYRTVLNSLGTEYISPDAFVIPGEDGKPVGHTYVRSLWGRIKERSYRLPEADQIEWGDRNLTPHSCRHSLNTHLLGWGAPPFQVQQFLGWESEIGKSLSKMQKAYAHLDLGGTDKVATMIDELIADREG